jgi:hypothetical protein
MPKPFGTRWQRQVLVEAAHVATTTQKTDFAAQDRRMAARRGKKRALMALDQTILPMAYHVLTRKQPSQDVGAASFDPRNPRPIEPPVGATLGRARIPRVLTAECPVILGRDYYFQQRIQFCRSDRLGLLIASPANTETALEVMQSGTVWRFRAEGAIAAGLTAVQTLFHPQAPRLGSPGFLISVNSYHESQLTIKPALTIVQKAL